MEALKLQLKSALTTHNQTIETLFIGGGTPSCIEALEYKEVFDIINPYLKNNAEITVEANPNSATHKWLQQMFTYGVNRISFGVQSFNEKKLTFLGRSHNAQKAQEAIQEAQKVGFKKINCDLIYGVVNDTMESLKKDIDIIKSFGVDHISAYSLILEEGTKFFQKNSLKIDDELLSKELFEYLENKGYKQYEIANFAQSKSSQSLHNIGYWQHKEYLGIGAGAVGYVNYKRAYTHKDIEKYIQAPLEYEEEILSKEDIKMEKVLLGFRCFIGVEMSLFTPNEKVRVEHLIEENKVYIKDNTLFTKEYLLADELALYILD